jgi:Cu/Ag efflux pump CusA
VKGAVDLQFKRESAAPVLSLKLRQQALAAHGLKGQEVLDALEGAYAGRRIGQTFVGTRTVDTVILLPDALRRQPAGLGDLMISSPTGPVPLKQVANIELVQDRFSIQHDGGQRLVTVGFNIEGRSTQDVVAEAQRALAGKVTLPTGVYLEFSGQAEAERQTRNQLIVYSSAAVIAILMLLFTAFHWRANAWLVLLNLPFSLIGAVLVIALAGLGISLGTILGLVTVFGISARNAILLLAHYEHLVEHEVQSWNEATVLRGANERFIPILMTAAMTAIGLLPLALGLHSPGQEIEGPMAVTVLGGLVSSTLLNLLVLPALAQHAKRREVSAAAR